MTSASAIAHHPIAAFPVTRPGDTMLHVTQDHGPARGHRYSLIAPAAPADARALVRRHAPDTVADDAELAASELVTNALRHAGGADRVTLTVTATALILSVTDARPEARIPRPDPALAFDLDIETGRGLAMILALGAELAVRRAADRKRVTARLSIPEGGDHA